MFWHCFRVGSHFFRAEESLWRGHPTCMTSQEHLQTVFIWLVGYYILFAFDNIFLFLAKINSRSLIILGLSIPFTVCTYVAVCKFLQRIGVLAQRTTVDQTLKLSGHSPRGSSRNSWRRGWRCCNVASRGLPRGRWVHGIEMSGKSTEINGVKGAFVDPVRLFIWRWTRRKSSGCYFLDFELECWCLLVCSQHVAGLHAVPRLKALPWKISVSGLEHFQDVQVGQSTLTSNKLSRKDNFKEGFEGNAYPVILLAWADCEPSHFWMLLDFHWVSPF